jgi:nucleotide-binding universal stress UspA family protein
VLPTVAEVAIHLNAAVVLMRVLIHVYSAPPDDVLPVFGSHAPNPNEPWDQARAEGDHYLAAKSEQLRAEGVDRVSSVLIDGSEGGAAAAIMELAEKTGDNLIVMSSHGRSGIGRWMIGSVTERVVRHSNQPVLVIRTRP